MVFIEWWHVTRLCGVLLILAILGVSFWSVRKKRWFVRIPVQLVSGSALCAFILLFSVVSSLPGNTYSPPVYSPNKKMAVRIIEYNASGLGGADDTVELFTAHGFKSNVVFWGEFGSVEAQNIRWKSDSELEVGYKGTTHQCTSTRRVVVRCIGQQQDIR